jgi:hypothetical protein
MANKGSIWSELDNVRDDFEAEDMLNVIQDAAGNLSAVDDKLIEVIREHEKYKDDEFDARTIKELREHMQFIADALEEVKDFIY